MISKLFEIYNTAGHDTILRLVIIAIVFDTVFGCLRAVKEKKLNSGVGINGAIRKVGMLLSLAFLILVDALVDMNLIGLIPEEVREVLGLGFIGVAQFFALLYIAYETLSIFKNMSLCGLPVQKAWDSVREVISRYTDEMPEVDNNDRNS